MERAMGRFFLNSCSIRKIMGHCTRAFANKADRFYHNYEWGVLVRPGKPFSMTVTLYSHLQAERKNQMDSLHKTVKYMRKHGTWRRNSAKQPADQIF